MILLDRLTKSFGAKQVLRGLTLEVPDGRNTVIIGASGGGKSVTLKLIVGLIEPDAGAVRVDGEVVHEMDRHTLAALRGRIGYVFQFAALFDSMTVAENIRLGLVKRRLGEDEIRSRIEESLAVVELPGVEDKYPAELSGGMRKRVGIARAIALKPRYILYDEPTTGLDPVTSAVMDQLMTRWCASSSRAVPDPPLRRRRGGSNEAEQRVRGGPRGAGRPGPGDRRCPVAE